MPDLINVHDFAVYVADIGRELAPFETIAVEDEDIVRKAIATGVLHSDIENVSDDVKKSIADAKAIGEQIAATWHAEHGKTAAPEAAVAVKAEDKGIVPFVSTAQHNHVEGLALGAAKLAERPQGTATLEAPEQLPAADQVADNAPAPVAPHPSEPGDPKPEAPKPAAKPAEAAPEAAKPVEAPKPVVPKPVTPQDPQAPQTPEGDAGVVK